MVKKIKNLVENAKKQYNLLTKAEIKLDNKMKKKLQLLDVEIKIINQIKDELSKIEHKKRINRIIIEEDEWKKMKELHARQSEVPAIGTSCRKCPNIYIKNSRRYKWLKCNVCREFLCYKCLYKDCTCMFEIETPGSPRNQEEEPDIDVVND